MKTKFFIFILLLAFSFASYAQELNFKSKTQLLIPEKEYLPDANWEKLFYDDSQSNAASRVGLNKQVVFARDGSIFISDRMKYSVTKLDVNGNVVKTFGKKGGNPGEFISNQDLHGVLNDKYLVFSDAQGRLNFFDLNGNFYKMITLDFMPLNIYPAKDGKLIIQGHVPYGTKSKKLLAELDFVSEKYEQIYYTFQDYTDPKGGVSTKGKNGQMIGIGSPFGSRRSYYRVTSHGQVILGINDSDVVKVFSKTSDEYKQTEFKLQTTPIAITEKEKEEYYQNFKGRLESNGLDASLAEKVKQPGYFPEYLPYYYNLILDDKNNCLFFMYSNDKKDHLFRAYTTEGEFLGESEFKVEGYDLMSKLGNFKFMNGYVYTLALKKNEDKPLRIIKCKVVSQ